MSQPPRALLLRLGPWPGGAAPILAILALLIGMALGGAAALPGELLPGSERRPDGPMTWNYHWLVHSRGLLGATDWGMVGWPARGDRLTSDGFPLDALASQPLVALLGWPAGLTAWIGLSLLGLAAGTAWLAGRASRSRTAALVAGAAVALNGSVLFELAEGRPTMVMAVAFLPWCWGWAADAMATGRLRPALASGAMLALASLTWWYALPLGLLSLLVLAGAGAADGLLRPRVLAAAGAAFLLVAGLPLAHALADLGAQPGLDLGPGSVLTHAGSAVTLEALTARRALDLPGLLWGPHAVSPVVLLLILGVLVGSAPLRDALVLGGISLGFGLLALGPWVALPDGTLLPGPYRLALEVPVLRRWWWPERALLIAAPAAAALAGVGAVALRGRLLPMLPARGRRGASLAWAGALLLAVVGGALLQHPDLLPLPSTRAQPSTRALALAHGGGPVLLLPSPSGLRSLDARAFLDQVHHGRPLVNGPMHPGEDNAPRAWRDLAARPGLRWLMACEVPAPSGLRLDPPAVAEGRAALRQLGLVEVHLDWGALRDSASAGEPAAYRACVEALLGPVQRVAGPYLVYGLPPPAAPAPVEDPAPPLP